MDKIQMVDLHRQYLRLRPELDLAMQEVMDTCAFINGPQVQRFASHPVCYSLRKRNGRLADRFDGS